jgi:hypothetical protein
VPFSVNSNEAEKVKLQINTYFTERGSRQLDDLSFEAFRAFKIKIFLMPHALLFHNSNTLLHFFL